MLHKDDLENARMRPGTISPTHRMNIRHPYQSGAQPGDTFHQTHAQHNDEPR